VFSKLSLKRHYALFDCDVNTYSDSAGNIVAKTSIILILQRTNSSQELYYC